MLVAYDFRRVVRGKAEPELRKEHPKAYFVWPDESLNSLVSHFDMAKIGIPQGNALSPILANIVLGYADRTVANAVGPIIRRPPLQSFKELQYLFQGGKGVCTGTRNVSVAIALTGKLETVLGLLLAAVNDFHANAPVGLGIEFQPFTQCSIDNHHRHVPVIFAKWFGQIRLFSS